jgi:uncharacterized OsmC-like protein
MSDYHVTADLTDQEWRIANKAREYSFICDDMQTAPNPVEYFVGSIDSCITMSAGMVAKSHDLDVRNFHLDTKAQTKDLGHGLSKVVAMKITVSFDSSMSQEEKEKFLAHTLHVSTVYQTVKDALPIEVELAK